MKPTDSLRALTLVELLIAMAIFSIVSAICIGAYMTLQRGFLFMNNWSDVRNAQALVLDAVAQDLRNATKISGTDRAVPISILGTANSVNTLSFDVPQFYSDYYAGSSYDNPPVPRAGTPLVTASTNSLYTPLTSGSTVPTATVVYSGTTIGSNGRVDLIRTFSWSGTSACRTIATFPNGVSVTYQLLQSGSTMSVTSSTSATAVRILVTGSVSCPKPVSTGTLQDTVYLRAYNLEK